jgi:hypothetical protein
VLCHLVCLLFHQPNLFISNEVDELGEIVILSFGKVTS